MSSLLITSWNVNGYNLLIHNWLTAFINISHPDIIFLSETKRGEHDLAKLFSTFIDYNFIINSHTPQHLHGVAMLIRKPHIYQNVPVKMGIPPRSDNKTTEASTGRIILISLNNKMYLIGSYTPNSRSNFDYRVNLWDPAFATLLETLRQNGPTMWIGDINVAPTIIDVSNPRSMAKYAGFSAQERGNFNTLISSGNWIDIWRYKNPTSKLFTWRGSSIKKDYGMRLDNMVVSNNLIFNVMEIIAYHDVPSSDHIMIGAYIIL